MPCPKCNGVLVKENGVEYCEDCLHVVERRGDPKFKPEPKMRGKGLWKKQPAKGLTCKTEGCSRSVYAKGLCRRCYNKKWYRGRHS